MKFLANSRLKSETGQNLRSTKETIYYIALFIIPYINGTMKKVWICCKTCSNAYIFLVFYIFLCNLTPQHWLQALPSGQPYFHILFLLHNISKIWILQQNIIFFKCLFKKVLFLIAFLMLFLNQIYLCNI